MFNPCLLIHRPGLMGSCLYFLLTISTTKMPISIYNGLPIALLLQSSA